MQITYVGIMAIYQHSCQYIKSTGVSVCVYVCVRERELPDRESRLGSIRIGGSTFRCGIVRLNFYALTDWHTRVSVAI